MPSLSRWFIRTALAYLLAGLIAGIVQVASPFWGRLLWPTYLHLLVVGWLTQLIFGVAFWMFPRLPSEIRQRGERLGWVSYWSLNAGMLLRIIGEPARAAGVATDGILLAAALLQLAGAGAFIANMWPRVKDR